MSQIFLSYKREDKDKALRIAEGLIAEGFTVWWDVDLLPGDQFALEIERVIAAANCVVVLWSESAVTSNFVRAEARLGLEQGKLVPITLDGTKPPLPFNELQTLNLEASDGAIPKEQVAQLVKSVRRFTKPVNTRVENAVHVHQQLQREEETWKLLWASIRDLKPESISEYELFLEKYTTIAAPEIVEYCQRRVQHLKSKTGVNRIRNILVAVGGVAAFAAAMTQIVDTSKIVDYLFPNYSPTVDPAEVKGAAPAKIRDRSSEFTEENGFVAATNSSEEWCNSPDASKVIRDESQSYSKIAIIDTHFPSKWYDEDKTVSNPARIQSLIDEQVHVANTCATIFMATGRNNLADKIKEYSPDLIVVHRSAFHSDADNRGEDRFETFLSNFSGAETAFLIYSRQDDLGYFYEKNLSLLAQISTLNLHTIRLSKGDPFSDEAQKWRLAGKINRILNEINYLGADREDEKLKQNDYWTVFAQAKFGTNLAYIEQSLGAAPISEAYEKSEVLKYNQNGLTFSFMFDENRKLRGQSVECTDCDSLDVVYLDPPKKFNSYLFASTDTIYGKSQLIDYVSEILNSETNLQADCEFFDNLPASSAPSFSFAFSNVGISYGTHSESFQDRYTIRFEGEGVSDWYELSAYQDNPVLNQDDLGISKGFYASEAMQSMTDSSDYSVDDISGVCVEAAQLLYDLDYKSIHISSQEPFPGLE